VREGTDNLVDDLYTGPNIKTANDLIGKSIAVSSFSSTTYGEALIAIKSLGLSASQVTIQAVGPDAARKAALVAGSVGGSMNGDSEKAQLAALGFKPLVVLATLGSGLPGQLLETTQAFASKNPNTVLAMVAAMNEGTLLFVTNTEAAIAAEVKIYNVPVAQATSDVAADQIGFQPIDGVNKPQDWTAGMALWEKTDSALASVDVTTAYTNKYSDQLKALGWYTSLKFPGY
jgi:ABC-type nitrate/sulfonate/bicarbonate transport system substrate-binding protein